jgi:hypothetical protein
VARQRFEKVSPPGAALLFGSTSPGFGILEVGADGAWGYRFEDGQGAPVHCCAAPPGGRCRPVPCR